MSAQLAEEPADALDSMLASPATDAQSIAAEIDRQMSVGYFRAESALVPLRPLIIPAVQYRALVDVGLRIRTLVVRACQRRARRLADLAALVRPAAPRSALWTEHPSQVQWATAIARPDLQLASGVPQVLELNVNSAMGGAPQVPRMDNMYWQRTDIRAAANRWQLWSAGPGLARDALLHQVGGLRADGRPPAIALVGWEDPAGKGREAAFAEVIGEMRAHGLPARYVQPDGLTVRDGRAYAHGTPADILLRSFTSDDADPGVPLTPLRDVIRANAAVVLSPEPGLLFASKLALAWLWRDIEEMPPEDSAFVRRHVPYTWELGPETGDEASYTGLRDQRDRWVLKPWRGHSGDGILIGSETTPLMWEEAVRQARKTGGFIAQRSVVSDVIPVAAFDHASRTVSRVPHRVVFGPMLYGDKCGGVFARHMPAQRGMLIGAFRGAAANCTFAWEAP